ncbi:hypothetical protein IWX49DRAFT_38463 [Phyllosticta citricarpa]
MRRGVFDYIFVVFEQRHESKASRCAGTSNTTAALFFVSSISFGGGVVVARLSSRQRPSGLCERDLPSMRMVDGGMDDGRVSSSRAAVVGRSSFLDFVLGSSSWVCGGDPEKMSCFLPSGRVALSFLSIAAQRRLFSLIFSSTSCASILPCPHRYARHQATGVRDADQPSNHHRAHIPKPAVFGYVANAGATPVAASPQRAAAAVSWTD